MDAMEQFIIKDKVVVITGGAGLLGKRHAEAVIDGKGIPIILDITELSIKKTIRELHNMYGDEIQIDGYVADITNKENIECIKNLIMDKYGHIDVLINNAANNPKVEKEVANMAAIQFENFPMNIWENDIKVGLLGAFLCAQVFAPVMTKQKKGVILNISSDLGIIAPDQRIYRKEGKKDEEQSVKPVTYSVIKHGLIGLTKYLATYYADKGIRVNALCPGGIYNGQENDFYGKLTNLIPMQRMAEPDEYKSTVLYMISDASSYMTGSNVVVDGGRTCW